MNVRAEWAADRYLAGPSFPDGRQHTWETKTPPMARCQAAATAAAQDAWASTFGEDAPGWVGGKVSAGVSDWWTNVYGPTGPPFDDQVRSVAAAQKVPHLTVAWETGFTNRHGFAAPSVELGMAVRNALALLAEGYDLPGVVSALEAAGSVGEVHIASHYTRLARTRARLEVALAQVRALPAGAPWWELPALVESPQVVAGRRWLAAGGADVAGLIESGGVLPEIESESIP